MVTRKGAKKRSTAKRKNDLLRELLRVVVKAIDSADAQTQSRTNLKKLRQALPGAIQELKTNPGGVQTKGD